MVASPTQTPWQSNPAVLPWFLKSKKNIAGFVTFTPAKHLLLDRHLDTLCPSLEKSFANSKRLIFRGMWCPPPLCHPQAAKSARFTPTTEDSSSWGPHPKREEGRKREGEQHATVYYAASTSTRDSDGLFEKKKAKKKAHSKHLMQRIMHIPTGQDYTYRTTIPGLTPSLASKDTSLQTLCTQIY